jgi:hypothetical protein
MKPLFKTNTRPDQRLFIAGSAALLALAAMGFSSAAHARDNLIFSVGISLPGATGAQVGVTNAYPVYTQQRPVYVQPQPVYVQPQPVYVQPAPVVYQQAPVYYSAPPVYVQPQPVYYGRPHGWQGHREYREHGELRGFSSGYGPGYAPVYFQR